MVPKVGNAPKYSSFQTQAHHFLQKVGKAKHYHPVSVWRCFFRPLRRQRIISAEIVGKAKQMIRIVFFDL